MTRRKFPMVTLSALVLLVPTVFAAPPMELDQLVMPDGFRIEVYAEGVPGARSLARSDGGVVYVGSQRGGKVFAVIDQDGDHSADRVVVVADGLNTPNGVAWRDGALYIAEIDRILKIDDIDRRLDNPPAPVVVRDGFPEDRHHGWKFIRFSPDGRLFVPVGAPCNICDVDDPYAAILSLNADGSDLQTWARGVRNTVGFDWHPATGELWFTDNGRDMMGDDLPPDELNRAPTAGLHFGYPYCHGDGIADPEKSTPDGCSNQVVPVQKLQPHAGAVGMRFYTGSMFPAEYRNQVLIAEHGSWNRSVPVGYRISLVRLEGSKAVAYEGLVEGWLQGRKSWGRPVDIEALPDGSVLISDDLQGVLYRLSWSKD